MGIIIVNKIPLYIHIPRTGGTFLREYFRKCCPGIQIHEHNRVRDLTNPDQYWKFAFVRNPWDWYVSRYFYFCRKHINEQGVSIRCDSGLFGNAFQEKFPTLKSHLLWGANDRIPGFWLTDRLIDMCWVNGYDEIDYYGRYEEMESCVKTILDYCSIKPKKTIPEFLSDPDNLRYKNSTIHEHYSEYYDEELKRLVAEKDDIFLNKRLFSYCDWKIYKFEDKKKRYNFCTVSDIKYLNQGLCMYDSLVRYSKTDFTLYYLCIDRESYVRLQSLDLPNVVVMCARYVDEFNNYDNRLYQGYCWSLASRLCNYLLNTKEIDDILYVDSDIVFYEGIENIYNDVKKGSIGIIPHLHVSVGCTVGGYNVGIIYFRNNEIGRECCQFWTNCVLGKYQEYIGKYDTCGDQKFLELFEQKWEKDVIIIGETTGHGAPWNLFLYKYDNFSIENKIISFKSPPIIRNLRTYGENKLIFCHFAGFTPDYENNTYAATKERFNENFLNIPACRKIYNEYFQLMKETYERYY